MIYGIGTDIVHISRIKKILVKYEKSFAQRILTPPELQAYASTNGPAQFLAKRFVAKEAAAKAFGLGFQQGLSFRHIGTTHDKLGKPLLAFYGQAKTLLERYQINETHLSLSDEEDVAIAFVIFVSES